MISDLLEKSGTLGIKKFLESSENGNTIYTKLQDTAKAVLRGKFIARSACCKYSEKPQ
jgi:hypothetical protein